TVIGFLRHHGLDKDFKLNLETNHATLAGHTMDHDMQVAADAGMLGSIDANRGDYHNAWDTDQLPNNTNETVDMMLVLLRSGGLRARRTLRAAAAVHLAPRGRLGRVARGRALGRALRRVARARRGGRRRAVGGDGPAGCRPAPGRGRASAPAGPKTPRAAG